MDRSKKSGQVTDKVSSAMVPPTRNCKDSVHLMFSGYIVAVVAICELLFPEDKRGHVYDFRKCDCLEKSEGKKAVDL